MITFFSYVFGSIMGGAMLVGLAGIAFLISIPVLAILRHFFPRLRPQQPPPIYLNLSRRHDATDYVLLARTPKDPVKVSPLVLEDSGTYSDEKVETERFPVAPTLPVLRNLAASPTNGNGIDPIIPIRRRALIRYLRRQQANSPVTCLTDQELIDSFLASVKGPKRLRYM